MGKLYPQGQPGGQPGQPGGQPGQPGSQPGSQPEGGEEIPKHDEL